MGVWIVRVTTPSFAFVYLVKAPNGFAAMSKVFEHHPEAVVHQLKKFRGELEQLSCIVLG